MVMFSIEQAKFMNNFVTSSGLLTPSNPQPLDIPDPLIMSNKLIIR